MQFVNTEMLKKIKIFKVGEEIDESDHCMIQLLIQNDWEILKRKILKR